MLHAAHLLAPADRLDNDTIAQDDFGVAPDLAHLITEQCADLLVHKKFVLDRIQPIGRARLVLTNDHTVLEFVQKRHQDDRFLGDRTLASLTECHYQTARQMRVPERSDTGVEIRRQIGMTMLEQYLVCRDPVLAQIANQIVAVFYWRRHLMS